MSTGPYTSQLSVQPQATSHSYRGNAGANAYFAGYPANSAPASSQQTSQHSAAGGHYLPHPTYYTQPSQPQGGSQTQTGRYSYYNYSHGTWSNAWNAGTYQYGAGGNYAYPYAQAQAAHPPTPAQPTKEVPAPPSKRKTPTPSPSHSPSPLPDYRKDWDAVIKSFLSSIGFSQALRGFEADMIVLNPDYERKTVPSALGQLMKDLLEFSQKKSEEEINSQERPLEERKLDYVHVAEGFRPRSQTSVTREISRFLAQNRARNDASNRNEFLLSLAEKRKRLNESGDAVPAEPIPSCARTDAKTQNRDVQMKYDIAKNEDGPLRRTLKSGAPPNSGRAETATRASANGTSASQAGIPTAERYPALDERLQNIEKHLAIRYVPSPPRSLLDRLKFLEDHIIHLEKEYPPWAALHFNQPNRGWPPPPRSTPIIVPSHLTSISEQYAATTGIPATQSATGQSATLAGSEPADAFAKGKAKAGRNTKSSLHRAVMEKLEVQKALTDLTGDGG
ncbi:hypothetical protein BD414DRAFT_481128 [Trametes punicea]|nr:hypothetical protein BD414DRAFT_481128 [Trametes punicea]